MQTDYSVSLIPLLEFRILELQLIHHVVMLDISTLKLGKINLLLYSVNIADAVERPDDETGSPDNVLSDNRSPKTRIT